MEKWFLFSFFFFLLCGCFQEHTSPPSPALPSSPPIPSHRTFEEQHLVHPLGISRPYRYLIDAMTSNESLMCEKTVTLPILGGNVTVSTVTYVDGFRYTQLRRATSPYVVMEGIEIGIHDRVYFRDSLDTNISCVWYWIDLRDFNTTLRDHAARSKQSRVKLENASSTLSVFKEDFDTCVRASLDEQVFRIDGTTCPFPLSEEFTFQQS